MASNGGRTCTQIRQQQSSTSSTRVWHYATWCQTKSHMSLILIGKIISSHLSFTTSALKYSQKNPWSYQPILFPLSLSLSEQMWGMVTMVWVTVLNTGQEYPEHFDVTGKFTFGWQKMLFIFLERNVALIWALIIIWWSHSDLDKHILIISSLSQNRSLDQRWMMYICRCDLTIFTFVPVCQRARIDN